MTTDPIDDAIVAIVALLRAQPELASVRIEDGPPPTGISEPDAIGVGVSTEDVEAGSTTTSRAMGSESEPIDIRCVTQSWSGETDFAPLRRRALELVEIVRRLLPQLVIPGVMSARVVRRSYRPLPAMGGEPPMALVEFTVRVDAYRSL